MTQRTISPIHELLTPLSQKEREVLELRFALGHEEKETLESIGQNFGLTRERVRQIEKNAIRKISGMISSSTFGPLAEAALERLRAAGGVLSHEEFIKMWPVGDTKELHLAFVSHANMHFHGNTLKTNPYWTTLPWNEAQVNEKIQEIIQKLKQEKAVISLPKNLHPIVKISKELKLVQNGVALFEWRHVNPRTLKDKILYIFHEENKNMHFEKMTEMIKKASFDAKRVNLQAVHNELIRNKEFVLVGRGIYALKEWGYEPGTVSDVIEAILKDGIARTREEITKEVLKRRQVKTVTIHLNLKNNPNVERVGRDRYALKTAKN